MRKLYIIVGVLVVLVVGGGTISLMNKPTSIQPQVPVDTTIPTTSASHETTNSNPSEQVSGYTLSQVVVHNNQSSCWTAINGKVYDVTSWINQHPGGSGAILSLCGKDGSASFSAQHGGQARPANELANFYIGELK
jgi:cytochrome b involved in lipid metabolism